MHLLHGPREGPDLPLAVAVSLHDLSAGVGDLATLHLHDGSSDLRYEDEQVDFDIPVDRIGDPDAMQHGVSVAQLALKCLPRLAFRVSREIRLLRMQEYPHKATLAPCRHRLPTDSVGPSLTRRDEGLRGQVDLARIPPCRIGTASRP